MKFQGVQGRARVLWPIGATTGLLVLLWAIGFVARVNHVLPPKESSQFVWEFQPAIVLPILFLTAVYLSGAWQSAALASERQKGWRHLAFLGALASILIAIESPLDFLSDHLFFAHMFEHMLLLMVAPILLVLAQPQADLMRGLPRLLRRYVLSPFLGSQVFRGLRVLGNPVAATMIFIAALYFWMIPYYQDLALRDEGVHELWHGTLLVAGLLFFSRVLDPRPHPQGASLGARFFMFKFASLANILLGSYLALKSTVLYSGYGPSPHLLGIPAAEDENLGGLTMWIPGCMMLALAAILFIRHYAREEDRREARRRASRENMSGRPLDLRSANRKVAVTLVSFAAAIFLIAVGTVLVYHFAQDHAGFSEF